MQSRGSTNVKRYIFGFQATYKQHIKILFKLFEILYKNQIVKYK
jgi:hypothetical protein